MVHFLAYRLLQAEISCSHGRCDVLEHSLPHRDGHADCCKLGEVLDETVHALQAAVDTVHEDVLPTLLLARPAHRGGATTGRQAAACGPAPSQAGVGRTCSGVQPASMHACAAGRACMHSAQVTAIWAPSAEPAQHLELKKMHARCGLSEGGAAAGPSCVRATSGGGGGGVGRTDRSALDQLGGECPHCSAAWRAI